MGNVVIDMSMSLDGYIAAPNDKSGAGARRGRDEAPQLGVRRSFGVRAGVRQPGRGTGAVIMGRRVLSTSAGQGDGSPITFYERYGFEQTGEIVFDNEVLLRLELR